METEAALIANDAIILENERILGANEAALRSGTDTPLREIKDIQPVPHV